MRITFNKVAYTILLGYLIVSCLMGYIIVRNKVWKERIQEEKFREMSGKAYSQHFSMLSNVTHISKIVM